MQKVVSQEQRLANRGRARTSTAPSPNSSAGVSSNAPIRTLPKNRDEKKDTKRSHS